MFRTRLLSGIVLMAITIALLVYGSYPLFWAITAVSVVGLFELYRTVGMEKKLPAVVGYISSVVIDILILDNGYEYLLMWMLATLIVFLACYVIAYPVYRTVGMEKKLPAVVGYISSVVIDILILDNGYEYLLMWMLATLVVFLACYVIAYPVYRSEQITMLLFGLVYVTMMLSFVFKLRFIENGILLVWLIFIGAWGSDTCAYCVGKLCGKHRLPSELSPNKTLEGCLGGVVGAALIGFLFALACFGDAEYRWKLAVIGGVSAVISQVGDLAASAIKRNHDIKDYGKLIPGHGGILDRFDSILFIAPIVYYLVVFLEL